MVKLPQPPAELSFDDTNFVDLTDTVLWRIHRTSGIHVVAWNRLRYWGPSAAGRFDPQSDPPRVQDTGVSYVALDIPTALAEAIQATRVINLRRKTPYVTGWRPSRTLRLLDLTGEWPLRNGASYSISTGRRDYCRSWARSILAARPNLDGLRHHSAMTGRHIVTLFTSASDSFADRPLLSLPLDHPGLRSSLSTAAVQIGYRIV